LHPLKTTLTQGCYIHIPFCERKCAYCDFNSHSGHSGGMFERYVDNLITEIEASEISNQPVDSIFFGGGTPTAIPASLIARTIDAACSKFGVSSKSDIEITIEANPGSSDASKFAALRAAGANRVSIGVQSFDDGLLKALGRIHTSGEALRAIQVAKDAGFENISIDLMCALPSQTMDQWRKTLDTALSLDLSHISMYSLIVEEGTPFAAKNKRGELNLPSDDEAADMFDLARSEAAQAGFLHYEISNYAKPDAQCRHNLHYWRDDCYYGFGAGAVSYQRDARETRIFSPARYCEAVEKKRA
jgi:oxygen-independent coproporphyrinogen-3 oxidase